MGLTFRKSDNTRGHLRVITQQASDLPDYETDPEWIVLNDTGGNYIEDDGIQGNEIYPNSTIPGTIYLWSDTLGYVNAQVSGSELESIDPLDIDDFFIPIFFVLDDPPLGPWNVFDSVSNGDFQIDYGNPTSNFYGELYDDTGGQYNFEIPPQGSPDRLDVVIEIDGNPYYFQNTNWYSFNFQSDPYSISGYGTFHTFEVGGDNFFSGTSTSDLRNNPGLIHSLTTVQGVPGTELVTIKLNEAKLWWQIYEEQQQGSTPFSQLWKIYYKPTYS